MKKSEKISLNLNFSQIKVFYKVQYLLDTLKSVNVHNNSIITSQYGSFNVQTMMSKTTVTTRIFTKTIVNYRINLYHHDS